MNVRLPTPSARLSWSDNLTVIDNSFGLPKINQRDDEIDSHHSCVPQSIIGALQNARVELPRTWKDPSDDFKRFMTLDQDVQGYYKLNAKYYYDLGMASWKVPFVAAYGVNRWIGRRVASFSYAQPLADILSAVVGGAGAVMFGNFDYRRIDGTIMKINHAVSISGFAASGILSLGDGPHQNPIPMSKVVAWLIDDPYGNPMTAYQNRDGDNIWIEAELFNNLLVEEGNGRAKTGILIRR